MVFFLTLHLDWRRWWDALPGVGVCDGVLQEGDVEYRVDSHGFRQGEADRIRGSEMVVGEDLEGAEAAMIQLAGGTTCGDVLGVQPHVITWPELGGGETMFVGVVPVTCLGTVDLQSKVFVDFRDGSCGRPCAPIALVVGRRGGEVHLPFWIEAVHTEEGGDTGCL